MLSTKQFSILILTIVLCAALLLHAQSSPSGMIMLGVQTSLAGCTWPTSYASISNGLAVCPLNLSTGPALAIAANNGAFSQIPMTAAAAGVTSFNGRTGAITLSKADVIGTNVAVSVSVTAPAVTSTATATAPTATATLQ